VNRTFKRINHAQTRWQTLGMKYRFRTISIFYFITLLLSLILIIGITGMSLFGIMETFFASIFTVSTFVTSYLIAYKLTIGKVEITLSNKKVEFLWVKKPILTFQNNESIEFDEIESWKFRTEFQYSYFKIYNPLDIITIMRLPNWSLDEDDFNSFRFAFKKRIENLNKKREKRIEILDKKRMSKIEDELINEQPKVIRDKESDFYNSNISKVLFYVYIICGILGAQYAFNNWNTGKTNIGLAISGVLGCIFYINKHKKFGNKK